EDRSWEMIVGHDRERQLLEAVIAVMLGADPNKLDGDSVEAFDRLLEKIAVDWEEGHLAYNGYTLDDLAGLGHRLALLTDQQRRALLDHYRLNLGGMTDAAEQ